MSSKSSTKKNPETKHEATSPKPSSQDLRFLLIGKTGHGKSASGNSILGKRHFKSASSMESVTRNSEMATEHVNGRNITVVDTPGLIDSSISGSEQSVKDGNMIFNTELCGDGFDCLVLVVKFGLRMTDEERVAIEKLKELLGKDVIREYTVLLFTHGDNFDPDEQKIVFKDWFESCTGSMRDLLEECENRYVLFNNKSKDNTVLSTQRQKFLHQVDGLLSKGKRYTNIMFKEVQEARRNLNKEQKDAESDMDCKTNDSVLMQEHHGTQYGATSSMSSPSDLCLLLLGKTGHGKSASGNSILGTKNFKSASSMEPVTMRAEIATETVDGRKITVVDTPGLNDTRFSTKKSIEDAKKLFRDAVAICPGGFDAIILLFAFGESMTDEDKVSVEKLNEILGKDFIREYIVVLISSGDNFDPDEEEMSFVEWCQSRKGFMRDLLLECENRCVLFNNRTKCPTEKSRQRQELLDCVDGRQSKGKRYTNFMFDDGREPQRDLNLDKKGASLTDFRASHEETSKMDTYLAGTAYDSPTRGLPKAEKRKFEDQRREKRYDNERQFYEDAKPSQAAKQEHEQYLGELRDAQNKELAELKRRQEDCMKKSEQTLNQMEKAFYQRRMAELEREVLRTRRPKKEKTSECLIA